MSSTLFYSAIELNMLICFDITVKVVSLKSLVLDALADGHALDLVNVNAVGFDGYLVLQLQPALLEGSKAVLGLDQTHLQLVDVFNQVLGLQMELALHVINDQLNVWPGLSLLDLHLAGGQGTLLG